MPVVRHIFQRLAPPTQAVFLAAVMGMVLGTAVPVSYLQQALSPTSQSTIAAPPAR